MSDEATTFGKDMTVGKALAAHPLAGQVFASFHLGGCAHCSISEEETLENVALGYGIPLTMLLDTLNGLPRQAEPAARA
jgi:hybrid cluster-associated redox disulfide protein